MRGVCYQDTYLASYVFPIHKILGHTPVPLDLMLSLSGTGTAYPQWREAVAYAAQRYSASGVILTLIPDFWHIDPNHHDYPGMRETRKHRATI